MAQPHCIARHYPTRRFVLAVIGALLLFGRLGLGCEVAFAAPMPAMPMAMSAGHADCHGAKPKPQAPKSDPLCLAACMVPVPAGGLALAPIGWTALPPEMGIVPGLAGTVPSPADPPPRMG